MQLLFIINAFLVFNSLSHIAWNKENLVDWYKRKVLRLLPLYWFFTIIYVIVVDTQGTYYLGSLAKVSWLNVLCNLLFVHGFYPYYANSINANWFMGVLAVFYLLAPVMYRIINSLERAIMAICIISPVGYVLRHVLLSIKVLAVDGIWQDYVNIISFPSELPVILLGVLVYYIYLQIDKRDVIKSKRWFSVSIVVLMTFFMVSLILKKDLFMLFNNIFSFGVLFAMLLLSQLIYPIKIFNNKFLAVIGKHSYGIYLSHIIIMKYMNLYWGKYKGISLWRDLIGYCILVLAAMVVSIMSEKLLEQELVEGIKRVLRR
ncbi:MAG: acyltransferase [Lachnospiraceae bacterium]|nr:acyltransferase [Lachnospiraceae bacterium]